jgi:hypothetical protein
MAQTVSREQVLAAIDAEHAAWEALVQEVGAARMEEPGPMGAWTFKDLAAHITGWRIRTLERLEADVRGESEPPTPWPAELEEDDEINTWIHEQNRDRSAVDVLRDASDSFTRLRAVVAALPDEVLNSAERFSGLGGQALGPSLVDRSIFGHLHEEHEPAVRAWLAGSSI